MASIASLSLLKYTAFIYFSFIKYHLFSFPFITDGMVKLLKPQPLLEAFGSKEAEYSSLFAYYCLMFETLLKIHLNSILDSPNLAACEEKRCRIWANNFGFAL